MSVDFGFRGGPTYRPTTRNEMFQSALDLPMNQGATFFDQAKGGVLESFGLGTAIKDTFVPEGNTARDYRSLSFPIVGPAYELTRAAVQGVINKPQPSLTEEQFKALPYHRDEIPYEPGMTEDRAAVLADWYDARKTREYFASKRPITSFVGNLAGQAIDPVNYLPVLGPLVKAAAVGKTGRIIGGAIAGALDASSNTALAAIATRETRGKAGDDVSWQSTVSQIATAALIGSVFGTIGGAVEKRADAKFRAATEDRLSTLRTTQEARIALNEAIGAVVRGEDIRLSPNSTEPMARVAEKVNPVRSPDLFAPLERVDLYSSTAVGRVIDSRAPHIADFETAVRGQVLADDPALAARYQAAEAKFTQAQERVAAIEEPLAARKQSDAVAMIDQPSADRLRAIESEIAQKPSAKRLAALEAEQSVIVESLGPDAIAKAESDFRIGPQKQAKKARQTLATARQEFSKVRREADAKAAQHETVARLRNKVAIDASPARPDPVPEGRKQAEAALSKPDDFKALAAQYRVDPETGSYSEEPDIKQIDTEGRLTEGDKAELEAAHAAYEDGAAYGEALKAAVGCII